MHVITGMLFAGLLGNRKAGALLPRLQLGPVHTEHVIPGRVRFRSSRLMADPEGAETLRRRLPQVEGVRGVRVSDVSGSILIDYCEDKVQPELLFAAVVRLLGWEEELERTPRPAVVRELRHVLDSLNRVVYDRTGGLLDFSSALLIVLAGLGVRRLLLDGAGAMPAGFTLVWWGVHQLLGHGGE